MDAKGALERFRALFKSPKCKVTKPGFKSELSNPGIQSPLSVPTGPFKAESENFHESTNQACLTPQPMLLAVRISSLSSKKSSLVERRGSYQSQLSREL